MSARCLAPLWSSGWGRCSPPEFFLRARGEPCLGVARPNARVPRKAGRLTSRLRYSSQKQSRAPAPDHALVGATHRALLDHAYTGHARVAGDGRLTEVAVVPISCLLPAATGSRIESAGLARGCRTNQTGCTNLTTADFADLVRAAQAGRAGPPRRKRFTPESSPCRRCTKSRDTRWFTRQPRDKGAVVTSRPLSAYVDGRLHGLGKRGCVGLKLAKGRMCRCRARRRANRAAPARSRRKP